MKRLDTLESKKTKWIAAPAHQEFTGGQLDEAGRFTPPTPEQEQVMNERLNRLGEVLGDAEFPWLLDGALNISLYGREFIRYHKDLDLTVFKTDIGLLIKRLKESGLAVAVVRHEKDTVLFRIANTDDFNNTSLISFGIVTVNPMGKIDMESQDPLHETDLHIHERDEEGNIVLEKGNMRLPKKYTEPRIKQLASGKEIRLSHPVLVAYHKLHMDREYDQPDLLRLRPYLTKEDIQFLKSFFQGEVQRSVEQATLFLSNLWNKIRLIAEQGLAVVDKAIKEDPLVQDRLDEENVRLFAEESVRIFSTQPQVSLEQFVQQVMHFHREGSVLKRKLDFLNEW